MWSGWTPATCAADQLLFDASRFRPTDVASSFRLGRTFDLVQCLEVAEHLDPSASETLVDNLVAHAPIVVFSAAPPGQGGENHINERPYEFWRDLFEKRGYSLFDFLRPQIRLRLDVEHWYRYNMLVFVRHDAVDFAGARGCRHARPCARAGARLVADRLAHAQADAVRFAARGRDAHGLGQAPDGPSQACNQAEPAQGGTVMKAQLVAFALIGAVLAALGQVSFKCGAQGRSGLLEFVNLWIFLGLFLYLAGTVFWILRLVRGAAHGAVPVRRAHVRAGQRVRRDAARRAVDRQGRGRHGFRAFRPFSGRDKFRGELMTSSDLPTASPTVLSIVVPCFNEDAVLRDTYARLSALRDQLIAKGKISQRSEILFVDDGSRDGTWDLIDSWVRDGAPVVGVKLSRNCGHQNALLAGLSSAKGDAVITIDADLQDDEAPSSG